jgi:hypothetical protein
MFAVAGSGNGSKFRDQNQHQPADFSMRSLTIGIDRITRLTPELQQLKGFVLPENVRPGPSELN